MLAIIEIKSLIFLKQYLLLFIIVVFTVMDACAQTLPDSVVIIRYRFFNKTFDLGVDGDSVAETKKTVFSLSGGDYTSIDTTIDNLVVNDLLSEVYNPVNQDTSLKRFGIDTNWIKQNPENVLKLSTYFKEYKWNSAQKQLILKAITNVNDYRKYFSKLLESGCCYGLDNYVRFQYKLSFYKKGRVVSEISSRRYTRGWEMPWTDDHGHKIYSSKIDELINTLQNIHSPPPVIPTGKKLLKELADYIVGANYQKLHELAPYTFLKEIEELKPEFEIISLEEQTGYGGYFGDGPFIEIVLHNSTMLSNLNIRFLAKEANGTIYSRDSVIKDYKKLVERVQSIKFITNYLKAHPDEVVDVMYFNNKPINEYNIDGVNNSKKGWDEYDRELSWLKNNKDTTSDGETVQKMTERLYCGCDYRFTHEFIGNAIMFLAHNEVDDFSRWFLLPDNSILLYMTEGPKAMGHEFSKNYMVADQCVRFDINGKVIHRSK
jgi:hypothetical protein